MKKRHSSLSLLFISCLIAQTAYAMEYDEKDHDIESDWELLLDDHPRKSSTPPAPPASPEMLPLTLPPALIQETVSLATLIPAAAVVQIQQAQTPPEKRLTKPHPPLGKRPKSLSASSLPSHTSQEIVAAPPSSPIRTALRSAFRNLKIGKKSSGQNSTTN